MLRLLHGEKFDPIEVIGLLYLCANRAEWRELKVGDSGVIGLVYRSTNSKGAAKRRTNLATLDESGRRLFVYSPEWRPDFDRELWITPDEAPVHRDASAELPLRLNSKGGDIPEVSGVLFGKQRSASNSKGSTTNSKNSTSSSNGSPFNSKGSNASSKGVVKDFKGAKKGIYMPESNHVIPAGPDEDSKAAKKREKREKKKSRQREAKKSAGTHSTHRG